MRRSTNYSSRQDYNGTRSLFIALKNCENLDVDLEAIACVHNSRYSTVKCIQTDFEDNNNFFLGRGPATSTTPHSLDVYGASPHLTEILNMPLSYTAPVLD